jgi:hypothetical protein
MADARPPAAVPTDFGKNLVACVPCHLVKTFDQVRVGAGDTLPSLVALFPACAWPARRVCSDSNLAASRTDGQKRGESGE